MPLIDDVDFKSREESVTYNQAGLDLLWNFTTTAGAFTQTAVTPTNTGGNYDWVNQGNGLYTIEIPASGGATINNDTEGVGWFTGYATGILPWRGPVIGFRAAGLNNALIDSAYSTTRGLAGTALPDAAADAAGGLAISDAGGLDLDTKLANTNEVTAARMGALTDWINGGRLDLILDIIAADTTTDIPALIATLQTYVDTEVGTLVTEMAKVPKSDSTVTWNATALASINAEVVDALNVDTYAEPTGVPAATASLTAKIGRLHQALRNQMTVTNTAKIFTDDAKAALWKKALSDDGTTYAEDEAASP